MKTHPTALNEITSYEDLGRQIVGLRYDLLERVLQGMLEEARRQEQSDEKAKRVILSLKLGQMADGIECALEGAQNVAHVCRTHIEAEKSYLATLDDKYAKRQIMWNVHG
jgi:hypothetical protein